MLYPPLEFLNQDKDKMPDMRPGYMWDDYYPEILKHYFNMTDYEINTLSEDDFSRYVLSRAFMMPKDIMKGHYPDKDTDKWNRYNHAVSPKLTEIMAALGYTGENLKRYINKTASIEDIISDIRDVFVEYLIMDRWARNKQVLKPDPVFAKHLCATKELKIDHDMFKYLPFTTFYIDLEGANKDNSYGNIYGIFVDITFVSNNEVAVSMYVLDDRCIAFSRYLNFDFNEAVAIPTEEFQTGNDNMETVPNMIKVNPEKFSGSTYINSQKTTTLVLQLISYMQVTQPDIVEAPDMKHTYKKRSTIKNKYSEIYKQEVGIRIGKVISDNMKAFKEAEKSETERAKSENRKPPKPHIRSAHWQRFCVGKGRKERELRWVGPTFVCGAYKSTVDTDVVIHPVK